MRAIAYRHRSGFVCHFGCLPPGYQAFETSRPLDQSKSVSVDFSSQERGVNQHCSLTLLDQLARNGAELGIQLVQQVVDNLHQFGRLLVFRRCWLFLEISDHAFIFSIWVVFSNGDLHSASPAHSTC